MSLSWTDYTYALLMVSTDRLKTVPLGLTTMMGAYDLRWGEMMAGGVIITIPILVVLVFLGRWFVAGDDRRRAQRLTRGPSTQDDSATSTSAVAGPYRERRHRRYAINPARARGPISRSSRAAP